MVMSEAPERAGWTFELLGGRLCLDFANTVSGMRGTDPRDRLSDYLDLVAWGRQAGAISAGKPIPCGSCSTPEGSGRMNHRV